MPEDATGLALRNMPTRAPTLFLEESGISVLPETRSCPSDGTWPSSRGPQACDRFSGLPTSLQCLTVPGSFHGSTCLWREAGAQQAPVGHESSPLSDRRALRFSGDDIAAAEARVLDHLISQELSQALGSADGRGLLLPIVFQLP